MKETPITQVHIDLLRRGASDLGIELTDHALTQFSIYLEELLFWSPKTDLIAQTDPTLIIRKHFLDSIAVVTYLKETAAILDLGSGAGFPGIPLAIALPQTSVTLLESRRKRVSFLKEAARKIHLPNLTIYEGRAENLAENQLLQKAFAAVITRATWDITDILRFATPFLHESGRVFAMKGPLIEKSSGELEKIQTGFRLIDKHSYTLPLGHEQRQILIFSRQKVSRDT